MVDDRHVHGAEHAIRHGAWTGNLQEMASLVLHPGLLDEEVLILHSIYVLGNRNIVHNLLVDGIFPGA